MKDSELTPQELAKREAELMRHFGPSVDELTKRPATIRELLKTFAMHVTGAAFAEMGDRPESAAQARERADKVMAEIEAEVGQNTLAIRRAVMLISTLIETPDVFTHTHYREQAVEAKALLRGLLRQVENE